MASRSRYCIIPYVRCLWAAAFNNVDMFGRGALFADKLHRVIPPAFVYDSLNVHIVFLDQLTTRGVIPRKPNTISHVLPPILSSAKGVESFNWHTLVSSDRQLHSYAISSFVSEGIIVCADYCVAVACTVQLGLVISRPPTFLDTHTNHSPRSARKHRRSQRSQGIYWQLASISQNVI